MFSIYSQRHIILAFKFMSKKRFRRKNETVYESRKLLEYYKVADVVADMDVIPIIKCTYDGRTFALHKNKTIALSLPDYSMPFQKIIKRIEVIPAKS
jgi:Holliday junction resolvase